MDQNAASILFVFFYLVNVSIGQAHQSFSLNNWTNLSTLSATDTFFACGAYRDSIFTLGPGTSVYQWNLTSNAWTQQSPLSLSTLFLGQTWSQDVNSLFFLQNHKFGEYEMNTMSEIYPISSHSIIADGVRSCTAISNDGLHLFVLGGCTVNSASCSAINTFQIYDILNDTLINGPNMNTKRTRFACMVDKNNFLYAFGGQNDNGGLNSVEKINVSSVEDIDSKSWQMVGIMNEPKTRHRAVKMNENIYILGGAGGSGRVDSVEVVYHEDANNMYLDAHLPIKVGEGCAVAVNQQIYYLGGRISDSQTIQSIYWTNLITTNPTVDPSSMPTITANPSIYPSASPKTATEKTYTPDITIYFNVTILSTNITIPHVLDLVEQTVSKYVGTLNVDASYELQYDIIAKATDDTIIPVIEIEVNLYDTGNEIEIDTEKLQKDIEDDLQDEYGEDVQVNSVFVKYWNELQNAIARQSFYDRIAIYIGCACFGIFIVNLMDQKCFRRTDIFKMSILISGLFQLMDTITDSLFIATLKFHDDYTSSTLLFYLFIAAISCMCLAGFVSMAQMYYEINFKWRKSNNVELKLWLSNNQNFLYFLSFINASSFTAVYFTYSGMMQLNKFQVPLTTLQFYTYTNKRIFSIVLLENVPQLIIQSIFIKFIQKEDITDPMTFISMIFSAFSIFSAGFAMWTQKTMLEEQDYMIIKVDVKGDVVEKDKMKYARRIKTIQHRFAEEIRVPFNTTDMRKPMEISNGLEFKMIVFVGDIHAKQGEIKFLWDKYVEGQGIKECLKKNWNLKHDPDVSNPRVETVEPLKSQMAITIQSSGAEKEVELQDMK